MSDVDQNSLKALGWSAASSEIRESTCTTNGLSTKGQACQPKKSGSRSGLCRVYLECFTSIRAALCLMMYPRVPYLRQVLSSAHVAANSPVYLQLPSVLRCLLSENKVNLLYKQK